MMTQGEIEALSARIEQAASRLELEIMKDIVRRIKANENMTSTAEYQINRLRQMELADGYIKQQIQAYLKASDSEINHIFSAVVENEYDKLGELFSKTGRHMLPFGSHVAMQAVVQAAIQQTRNSFRNITQTMGFTRTQNGKTVFLPISEYYQKALDDAVLGVATGAFDYNTALNRVVSEMTRSGFRTVDYASGRRHRIESASRTALMTGLGQVTGYMNEQVAQELGTDDFEVSYHMGARTEHQVWQGRVYSYEELRSVCGLGTVTGLCGANCYHWYEPFVKGVSVRNYTDEELDAMMAEENRPRQYNGKEYTTYTALQKQRSMERTMRKQRQDIVLLKEGEANELSVLAAQTRYRFTMQEYARLSESLGLPQQRERVYMDGLGRVSVKTGALNKLAKELEARYNKGDILSNIAIKQKDISLAKHIRSEKVLKAIEPGKQGKHMKGHNNYIPGRSYLTISEEEAQELVNRYAGHGRLERDRRGRWNHKENIIVDRDIGVYVNKMTGEEAPTNRFTIHYSNNGAHIVPAQPERR